MERKLTPDDLEIGKEYYIVCHNHYRFGRTGAEKYDGQSDGIYIFLNKINCFEFINIENKRLRLVYNDNNFKLAYWTVNCDISEATNEYIISELTNEYVLK